MGSKSRGNWAVNACIAECVNRDILCEQCYHKDLYKPLNKVEEEGSLDE